jgi:hypothetical protein
MDFFAAHGVAFGLLLILGLVFIPRITMLGMLVWGTLTSGGVLWWLGYIFLPGIVVAYEATTHYWDTNPVLCVFAWFVAFTTSNTESRVTARTARRRSR